MTRKTIAPGPRRARRSNVFSECVHDTYKSSAKPPTPTLSDVHLAHGIGEALQRACKGTLDSRYSPEEKLVRVRWSR